MNAIEFLDKGSWAATKMQASLQRGHYRSPKSKHIYAYSGKPCRAAIWSQDGNHVCRYTMTITVTATATAAATVTLAQP